VVLASLAPGYLSIYPHVMKEPGVAGRSAKARKPQRRNSLSGGALIFASYLNHSDYDRTILASAGGTFPASERCSRSMPNS
jgi:hypothetical protein